MVLSYHAMFIDDYRTLWGSGSNTYGQIGSETGSEDFIRTPIKILENVIAVSTGLFHSAAVTIDNRLFTFGLNDKGQLGLGHETNTATPTEVKFSEDVNIIAVECGLFHTLALDSEGNFWVWGDNSAEQCGLPNYSMFSPQDLIVVSPRKILSADIFDSARDNAPNLSKLGNRGVKIGSDIYSISCGNLTSLFRKNNQVYVLGNNSNSQLTSEVPSRTSELVRLNNFLPNSEDPTNTQNDVLNVLSGTEFTVLHTKSNDVFVAGRVNSFENGEIVSKTHNRFIKIAENVEQVKYSAKGITIIKKSSASLNQEILELPVMYSADLIYTRNYVVPSVDATISFTGEIFDFSPGIKYDIYVNGWYFRGIDNVSFHNSTDLLYNGVGRV